jgi:large subunit ribosomal protein L10
MQKSEKEQVVAELTERLRTTETLIVADYRGLTNSEIDGLRTKLIASGARFSVVKNTLTRRAAEAAGAEGLLTLLEGPTAIAFLESDGDPVQVAKALGDAARETKVLAIRGGVLQGKPMSAEEVESLAKLPPVDVLRGQVLGAVVGPLQSLVGLLSAPLTNLVGLIDARIAQLEEQGDTSGSEAPAAEAEAEPAPEPEAADAPDEEPAVEEPAVEEQSAEEPGAEEPAAEAEADAPAAEATETTEETTENQEEQE